MNILIIFLKILAIILGFVFLVVLMAIFTPCEYHSKAEVNDENTYFYVEIAIIFHLFKFRIYNKDSEYRIKLIILGKHAILKFNKKVSNEEKVKDYNKGKFNFLNKNFLVSCISYFKEVITLLKPKYVEINGTYGFCDPAETGFLCAFISMISQIIRGDYLHVNLQPDFQDEIIDIKVNVYGKLILFSVIYKTFKFMVKDEVREVLIQKS